MIARINSQSWTINKRSLPQKHKALKKLDHSICIPPDKTYNVMFILEHVYQFRVIVTQRNGWYLSVAVEQGISVCIDDVVANAFVVVHKELDASALLQVTRIDRYITLVLTIYKLNNMTGWLNDCTRQWEYIPEWHSVGYAILVIVVQVSAFSLQAPPAHRWQDWMHSLHLFKTEEKLVWRTQMI